MLHVKVHNEPHLLDSGGTTFDTFTQKISQPLLYGGNIC